MGASTSDHLTSHDLEMIDISWKFVDKKFSEDKNFKEA